MEFWFFFFTKNVISLKIFYDMQAYHNPKLVKKYINFYSVWRFTYKNKSVWRLFCRCLLYSARHYKARLCCFDCLIMFKTLVSKKSTKLRNMLHCLSWSGWPSSYTVCCWHFYAFLNPSRVTYIRIQLELIGKT